MTDTLFPDTDLDRAVTELRKDLLAPGGPSISAMRHYNFAILPYPPEAEFRLRRKIHELSEELRREGWEVLSIALQRLLFDRLRSLGEDSLTRLVSREKRLFARDPERALNDLREKLSHHLDGPEGLAADVVQQIDVFLAEHPGTADRTVVFLGRAGALYPFFRTSALLKYIDGRTQNVPVILLYPGTRRSRSGLSFMGELPATRDYRPRIYP